MDSRIHDVGAVPVRDGQVTEYASGEARGTPWFNASRKVLFINGMGNTGADHRDSAIALSLLQMCPVVGVFNVSGGFFGDLGQCIADKYQFHGPAARAPGTALDHAMKLQAARPGPTPTRAQAMERALERNPAALSMFRLLRRPDLRSAPIFAHSQGNLILSNSLVSVGTVDGERALRNREIRTFGSPTVNWPRPLRPIECGFTWDPVTWLSGFDWSFSISKVGMPGDSLNPLTHAFAEYMKSDPAFVINRFRWGSFGMTLSMDEKGLAQALVKMGTNMRRVRSVFERLQSAHPSDVDDVARLYVDMLRESATGRATFAAVKADGLHQFLIDAMEEGWTSGKERRAIDTLKGLG